MAGNSVDMDAKMQAAFEAYQAASKPKVATAGSNIRIEPVADWLQIKTKCFERISSGGLVLPATSMPEDEGVVLAVGPDVKRCKVGDRVVFTRCRSSQKGGEHCYLAMDSDIVAIVHES